MTKKFKIIFNKDLDNENAMESLRKLPLSLREMPIENSDLTFEKIKLENPKRFKILKEYIDRFKNNNNGLH